jgi:hypothetical protein
MLFRSLLIWRSCDLVYSSMMLEEQNLAYSSMLARGAVTCCIAAYLPEEQ